MSNTKNIDHPSEMELSEETTARLPSSEVSSVAGSVKTTRVSKTIMNIRNCNSHNLMSCGNIKNCKHIDISKQIAKNYPLNFSFTAYVYRYSAYL